MSRVLRTILTTDDKENENNKSNRKSQPNHSVVGKRKILNDSTNVQIETLFAQNKRPTFHTSVEVRTISIISDDENSNATAPSPTKPTGRDVSFDTKVKVRQELDKCQTEPQGPPLTILQLPASLWCIGIPRVPEIDLLPRSSDLTQNVDSRFVNDPEFVSFQARSMYETFFKAEKKLLLNSFYMDKQINFTVTNREQMVNLMMNLSRSLQLQTSTLFLSVHILDSYMPKRGSVGFLTHAELITIAYTCVMIAAKFEEGGRYGRGWYLTKFLSRFIHPNMQDETKRLMIQCELHVVLSSSHLINLPTIDTFLNRFILVAQTTHVVLETARCICERALLEYTMLQYTPSVVAASAVSMALAVNHHPAWSYSLQQATGYSQSDFSDCLEEMQDIFADETVQRTVHYVRTLFKAEGTTNYTFGALTQIVYDRGATGSGVSLRRQSYESYLLPILERAYLSSAECLTPTTSTTTNASTVTPLSSAHTSSTDVKRVDGDVLIPNVANKIRTLDNSLLYRHHHCIYNKLITCVHYD